MSTMVVTPPAAAARVAVTKPSHWVRPGSFTWTCVSTTPGSTTASPRSSRRVASRGSPYARTAVITPWAISTAAGPIPSGVATRRLAMTSSAGAMRLDPPARCGDERRVIGGRRAVRQGERVLEPHADVVAARDCLVDERPHGRASPMKQAWQLDSGAVECRLQLCQRSQGRVGVALRLEHDPQATPGETAVHEQLGAARVRQPRLHAHATGAQQLGEWLRARFVEIHRRKVRQQCPLRDGPQAGVGVSNDPRAGADPDRDPGHRGADGRQRPGHVGRGQAFVSIRSTDMHMDRPGSSGDRLGRRERLLLWRDGDPLVLGAHAAAVDRGFEKTRHAGRSAHRLLQLVEVELADLGHLRGDDGAAIALIRIAAVIVAVVLLRRVEHLESDDGGDDRVIPHLLGLELTDHLLHDRLLLRRVVEHGRTVLGADVRSLAVQSRGVVDGEEDVQQVAERYHRRVERDLYDLGVTGRSSAHVLVRWVGGVAARVSGLHPLDALQILERGFEAPEAATGERGGFELRHGHTSRWSSRKLTPVYRSTPNSSATMSVGAGTTMPRAFS